MEQGESAVTEMLTSVEEITAEDVNLFTHQEEEVEMSAEQMEEQLHQLAQHVSHLSTEHQKVLRGLLASNSCTGYISTEILQSNAQDYSCPVFKDIQK